MSRKLLSLLILTALMGCAPIVSQERLKRTAQGAVLGAGAGAAFGTLAGDPLKGAAIGALVGGAAGALSRPIRRTGRYGRGYRPGLEETCDQYDDPEDRQGCFEGLREGEPVRAQNIRNQCRHVGSQRGFDGGDYPQDVADQFEKDVYRDACAEGVREGWMQGKKRRTQHIKNRARRAASGYGW